MVLEKHDMVLYLICKRERLYYVYNATPNINLLVKEVPCASLLQWYYFCLYLLALYRVLWGSVSTSFKQIMMTSSNGNIFPRYWPFVRGIHRSPVNSPHKGQWRGAFMFSWICVWINNREAGDLRRYRAHYDVIVMSSRAASLVLDQFNDRPSAGEITLKYYDDVIMGAIASQITSLTIVYSTVYLGANQSRHQSSAPLAFVWGIHRGPVNSPHKWPVTRKMFPFDDVIMYTYKISESSKTGTEKKNAQLRSEYIFRDLSLS